MKEDTRRAWMRICYGVLIICGLGLVLAVLGLFCQQDPLCYAGLLMAAPLFLIVLPICILLLVFTIIGGIWELMEWPRSSAGKGNKTDDEPPQPMRSA
jgi:hypothetical protein